VYIGEAPNLTPGRPKKADLEHILISHNVIRSNPSPMAGPSAAAITGLGKVPNILVVFRGRFN
jgi:hypothetical protein